MIRIREAIVVEGRYDVNTVRQIVDTTVLESGGFRIFKDKERIDMLRCIAEKQGLIILTDSDGAGFVIRNHLRQCIPPEQLKQAYIPDLYGKEPRKRVASCEGKIGVEGMRPNVILQALQNAGATFLDERQAAQRSAHMITKADLYAHGLSGTVDSAQRRRTLLKAMQLPEHLSCNALLQYINAVADQTSFFAVLTKLGY